MTTESITGWDVVVHGARAGLLAGIVLGIIEIVATTALGGEPLFPFAFAAGILVGPSALSAGFSSLAAVALGTVMHLLISVGIGVTFLAALHVTFQLSARPPLMLLYGVLFGVTVWEVNFMAVLPILAPDMVGQLDLATQLVNGVATYSLVFGPVLAGYVLAVRPGVHDRWWEHHPGRAADAPSRAAAADAPSEPPSTTTSKPTMTSKQGSAMTAITPLLADIAFPLGIRITHAFNIVFLTLLVRSGIEILGGHPMLYFNDDCRPGSEWIRFSSKRMHRDQRWTAEDEKQDYNAWVALPGNDHLGLGRFWHFATAIGWLVTGVLYLLILFTTDQWTRVVPTDWGVFAEAWRTGLDYLALDIPASGSTYNALQQLTYFLIVFIVSPVQILTGLAMAPAIEGRVPWYSKLFGGRQAARSIHFIGMIVFIAFTVHHVALVIAHGLFDGLAAMVLGVAAPDSADHALAAAITLAFMAGLVGLHAWATRRSLQRPRDTQRMLQRILDPVEQKVLMPLQSRQAGDPADISVDPRPNGRPPRNPAFLGLAEDDFANFRLEVSGLVESPLSLSLDELAALPADEHVVQHKCIQGWSYIASWEGVALSALLDRVTPMPDARFMVFRTFDDKWEVTDDQQGGDDVFYAAVGLELARHPQSMLAWGMNGRPLPIAYGGPLRLRLESQLGYNMAKWVRSIDLVASIDDIGDGSGGWRPDKLYYSHLAPI